MRKRVINIIIAAFLLAFVGGKAYTVWHDKDLIMTASTHEHVVDLPIQDDSAFGFHIEKLLYDEDSKQVEIVMKRAGDGLQTIGLAMGEDGETDWGALANVSHLWCRHMCFVYDVDAEPYDLYIVDYATNERQLLSNDRDKMN